MMEVRNLKRNKRNTIDCEINHPNYGWIPFTATPDDTEQLGKDIYAKAAAGDYGVVAEYVAPTLSNTQVSAMIASRRYDKEVAGINWKGYMIATDRESQAKLDAEDRAVGRGLRVDGSGWKCLDVVSGKVVFRNTTNTEIQEIAAAVYNYVSKCFKREADLLAALEAGTYTEAMLESDWPTAVIA